MREKRPGASLVTVATGEPSSRVTTITAPGTGRSLQAGSGGSVSTGQTGPAGTLPATSPTGPGSVVVVEAGMTSPAQAARATARASRPQTGKRARPPLRRPVNPSGSATALASPS
jgi:hypothetical protein